MESLFLFLSTFTTLTEVPRDKSGRVTLIPADARKWFNELKRTPQERNTRMFLAWNFYAELLEFENKCVAAEEMVGQIPADKFTTGLKAVCQKWAIKAENLAHGQYDTVLVENNAETRAALRKFYVGMATTAQKVLLPQTSTAGKSEGKTYWQHEEIVNGQSVILTVRDWV